MLGQLQRRAFPVSGLWRWAPAAAWAVLLFALSSIPGDRYPTVRVWNADKFVHFLMYLPLGMFLARGFSTVFGGRALALRGMVASFVCGALYGASDEWHQKFVRNRSCDIRDWYVDVAAVAAGILTWIVIERVFRRQRS